MSFTAQLNTHIKTDNGSDVAVLNQFTGLTAKKEFDAILPAGTFDFAPYLANFPAGLKGILIASYESNFTVTLDGTNFSIRKYKQFFVQVDDVGVQALQITLSAQSRVTFIAVGS